MSKLTNLLTEIKRNCKVSEIDFISFNKGDSDYEFDKKWFLDQAKRIRYDPGYGGHVIDSSIKIVLKNGNWMERGEYDGSEWFELKQGPKKPDEVADKNIGLLFARAYDCPFNTTTIDDQSINPPDHSISKGYYTWSDNSGKIELKFNQYKEKKEEYTEYAVSNQTEEEY